MPVSDNNVPETLHQLVQRFLVQGLINPNMSMPLGNLTRFGWLLGFKEVGNILNPNIPAPDIVNELKMALKCNDGSKQHRNKVEMLAEKAFAEIAAKLKYDPGELEAYYGKSETKGPTTAKQDVKDAKDSSKLSKMRPPQPGERK